MYKFLSALLFITLLFTACGEDTKEVVENKEVEKVKTIEQDEKPSKAEVIDEVASKLKLSAVKAIDKASDMAKDISSSSSTVIEKIKEESVDIKNDTLTSVKEVSKDVNTKISSAVDSMMKKNEDEALSNIDAKQLYMKCAGCHGQKGEKSALNKSKVIQSWSSQEVQNALNGYKNDTYGEAMKGLMKSQVLSLSDEEIKLLSDYISNFK